MREKGKRFPEEIMEQIMELPGRDQYVIYSSMYSVSDADMMDQLEAAGAFKPERV